MAAEQEGQVADMPRVTYQAESHAAHTPHHWEWSYYPLILVLGIFFTVPIAFALMFEYGNGTMAALAAGIGVPLTVWGIAGWTSEGLAQKEEHGFALTGLPIFIVSEALIFLSLFAAYWTLRLSADVWPPPGSPHIGVVMPIVMTIVLVASSVTYHMGELKLEEGDKGGFVTWLFVTLALGIVFLGMTYMEYSHLISEGFVFGANAKSTAFYSITGFHASHVIIGLGVFLTVLIPALSGKISPTFSAAAGVYWHFVDIIWFFVVSQIYFW